MDARGRRGDAFTLKPPTQQFIVGLGDAASSKFDPKAWVVMAHLPAFFQFRFGWLGARADPFGLRSLGEAPMIGRRGETRRLTESRRKRARVAEAER